MNSKKYVIGFLLLVGIFFWGNVCLWHGYTKSTFSLSQKHGDLTRMAFLPNLSLSIGMYQPIKKHIEFRDYINMTEKPSVDMITLGDSFSNGGGGAYYQDYIVDNYGKIVLNFTCMEDDNPLTVLRRLIKTGLLAEIHPKIVVLESVERYTVARFDKGIKTPSSMTKEKFIEFYMSPMKTGKPEWEGLFPEIMTNANKSLIKTKFKYLKSKNRLSDEVYQTVLQDNLFSDNGRENILLYYYQDLWYQKADVNCWQINSSLNKVAEELRDMGIQLIVMINVDKFDLYYPYIAMPRDIPENNFMEKFSEQPRKYEYIDTKAILRKELEKGEKDIYWQDDTHWSWKAQHKVVDVMMETVK